MRFREPEGPLRHPPTSFVAIAVTAVIAAASLAAAPASAQESAPLTARAIAIEGPLLPVQDSSTLAELNRRAAMEWSADFAAWQRWFEEWGNTTEPGWFAARGRRSKPEPPSWLLGACDERTIDELWLTESCTLLSHWREDFATAQLRRHAAMARSQHEQATRSMWYEHIHLDALWPIVSDHGSSVGVVGTHVTMDVKGRLQIFIAPGVMLLNVPGSTGRAWAPATDWGFGYRLGRFRFPGSNATATAHLNLAKAWVFWGAAGLVNGTVDLVGLSLTFSHPRATAP